jgi:hypothetical protein
VPIPEAAIQIQKLRLVQQRPANVDRHIVPDKKLRNRRAAKGVFALEVL